MCCAHFGCGVERGDEFVVGGPNEERVSNYAEAFAFTQDRNVDRIHGVLNVLPADSFKDTGWFFLREVCDRLFGVTFCRISLDHGVMAAPLCA